MADQLCRLSGCQGCLWAPTRGQHDPPRCLLSSFVTPCSRTRARGSRNSGRWNLPLASAAPLYLGAAYITRTAAPPPYPLTDSRAIDYRTPAAGRF